jgi:hypothetical protein
VKRPPGIGKFDVREPIDRSLCVYRHAARINLMAIVQRGIALRTTACCRCRGTRRCRLGLGRSFSVSRKQEGQG